MILTLSEDVFYIISNLLSKTSFLRCSIKVPYKGGWSPPENERQILKHRPKMLLPLGNRYPSEMMAPETWQGWKELEESLSPSTMRDEIRLTRILIQYCDTRDEKVLDELKEWFAEMDEVQRTCMANSVFRRAKFAVGTELSGMDLFEPLRDLYHVVREYDLPTKSEYDHPAKSKNGRPDLHKLGLFE